MQKIDIWRLRLQIEFPDREYNYNDLLNQFDKVKLLDAFTDAMC